MLIYEYKYENGHVFDVMQKLSDDPPTSCIECGTAVRKVLHPVSISFKGSGFYSTDYRGASEKKAETKNGEAGTKTKSSGDKGSSTEKAAGKQDR